MRDPSQKIMKIRLAAGGSATTCPTCTRPAENPYRRWDASGRIIEGCVDAIHTGKLVPISSSNGWHMRKKAIAIRRSELDALMSFQK